MKFIVVPILILLVATQAFSKWVLLLEYRWNKEYIAQNLCENKAKPKLQCEGKCQLTKKMAAEEKGPSSPSQNVKDKFQEVLFSYETPGKQLQLLTDLTSSPSSPHLLKKYSAPVPAIFHPPA